MKTRSKLSEEHLVLLIHNLRLRWGHVVRIDSPFLVKFGGTCIDCGWRVIPGQSAMRAEWERHKRSGLIAHTKCAPIIEHSEWLRDVDFTVVFDVLVDPKPQRCVAHNQQVTMRQFQHDEKLGFTLKTICDACVNE